jgi:hypothetical protein
MRRTYFNKLKIKNKGNKDHIMMNMMSRNRSRAINIKKNTRKSDMFIKNRKVKSVHMNRNKAL